jgi:ribosomal protein L11 methyltransferase
MAWRSLIVEIEAGSAEALSEALLSRGALATSVEDADAGTPDERPVFDEPGATGQHAWRRARLTALLPEASRPDALLAGAAADAGLARTPTFMVEAVAERDWVRHTQSQFQPIHISERLWIVPTWHTPPDPAAISIALDPGLAFGTGSHPTTRLCLQWLERHVFPGARVLDYGCGSGILAIAALKLGAGEAVGVDTDHHALVAAHENGARNGVTARWLDATAPLDFAADLVVANILARPLIVLAPLLAAHCRAGGRIVLAGVLDAQADEVAAAYAPWFDMARNGVAEGWVALEGQRR